MNNLVRTSLLIIIFGLSAATMLPGRQALANGQTAPNPGSVTETDAEAVAHLAPGSAELINPEDLVTMLQSPKSPKPLVLNIGPYLVYKQAHIPGAEFISPSSNSQGMESLRRRVKSLPHNTFIVLYCGCCPWGHCPNVRPAYYELHKAGFTNVKVLYIADNFGADWV